MPARKPLIPSGLNLVPKESKTLPMEVIPHNQQPDNFNSFSGIRVESVPLHASIIVLAW